ncbi:hypothetical protein AALB39_16235 [Lachnospiraceae bacterium 54-53]
MGSELIKIAEGFSLVAEGIRELVKEENNGKTAEESAVKKQSDKVKTQNAGKAEDKTEMLAEQEQKISIEDIRAVLAEKSQDGKSKEVKTLLNKFGVAKLSAVDEKDYQELLQKAKVL